MSQLLQEEKVVNSQQFPTWPQPRVLKPCVICGEADPGHVLVEGIGHEYVAQVCSSHTLWEVLSAQRDGRELLNLVVQINDIDVAAQLRESKPFTPDEVDAAVKALDSMPWSLE